MDFNFFSGLTSHFRLFVLYSKFVHGPILLQHLYFYKLAKVFGDIISTHSEYGKGRKSEQTEIR